MLTSQVAYDTPLFSPAVPSNELQTSNQMGLFRYLQEIKQYGLLNREETNKLIIRFKMTATSRPAIN